MLPIVTPDEMAAIDAAAPEPVEVLIGRAGGAVARAAIRMLGGTYGRTVVVLAGKGNNGNDGRDAARRLRERGRARHRSRRAHISRRDATRRSRDRRCLRHGLPGIMARADDSRSGARRRHPERSRWADGRALRPGAPGRAHGDICRAEARPVAPARRCARRRDRGRGHRTRREQGASASRRGWRCRGMAPRAARDDAQVEGRGVGRGRFARNDRSGASRREERNAQERATCGSASPVCPSTRRRRPR